MQSTEGASLPEEPGSSQGLTNGDSNANLLNGAVRSSEAKGAVPKIKPAKSKSKKAVKLNNNIEDVSEGFFLDVNGTSGVPKPAHLSDRSHPLIDITFNIRNLRLTDDSDDDNLSISDDGCIYTYKGDQDADLPVSFFSLDVPPDTGSVPDPRRNNYSPEMDYLEMDFDPGPGGTSADGDYYEPLISNGESLREEEEEEAEGKRDGVAERVVNGGVETVEKVPKREEVVKKEPEISLVNPEPKEVKIDKKEEKENARSKCCEEAPKNQLENRVMPWSCQLDERTTAKSSYLMKKYHLAIGELVKPNDGEKTSPTEDPTSPDPSEESVLIWSPSEVKSKTVTQIGPSACGATAVINALNALNFPVSIQKVEQNIDTRLRKNAAPLTEYLLSRSVAGTTHRDIIDCIHKVTDGKVYARFFHMYPERVVNLRRWLRFWLKSGAAPIATLNIQQAREGAPDVPDAWHHQMIYGVNARGVHFANPVECVREDHAWACLVSESVLLVRRDDVVSRFNVQTDLPELMALEDPRWRSMNVVGQVAHIIYQSRRELRDGFKNTPHIRIPAAYSSGVTIALPVSSPSYPLLQQCPELPILNV